MRKLLVVLGIPIDLINMAEALDRIEQMVRVGRATGKAHQIATVNVDFLVKASFDPELRYLLQHADLLTADGMPLVWGARWLGGNLEGRVAGADLVPALAERAAECGLSLYFLGGEEGVAARAAALLKEKHPQLQISGVHSPPFSPVLDMDVSFLDDIRAAKPDILLVAFGNPKQEKWIGMHGRNLGVPVLIGVGGSLDFIAGHMRRAPEWMQQVGLEWLFRLLQEPRRLFRRYVTDMVVFGNLFFRQWWLTRRPPVGGYEGPAAELENFKGNMVLHLRGCLTVRSLNELYAAGKQALASSPHLLVDLEQAEFFDSYALGGLLELGNQARNAGGSLVLICVPERVQQTLEQLKLDKLFLIYPDLETFLAEQKSKPWHGRRPEAVEIPSPTGSRSWTVLKSLRVLDASTAPDFIHAGTAALNKNPFLICDLSETVFLASSGLAALTKLRQMALNQQGELRVVNCSEDALQVIKMARFDRVLPLYNDYSLALA